MEEQSTPQRIEIRPQSGFQEKFLSSPADVVVGGGAAGSGKTHGMLLDPIRYLDVKGFGGVIFRRTTPQIRNEGALWDSSATIYPYLGGVPKESVLEWHFPKSKLKFSHLEHEKNIYDHQGAQYAFIGFDELTHFTKKQFYYLLTRNRSVCGVMPYVRATCNPDPDSWVADFIAWWIDEETGYPIPERDGVLRYFTIDQEVAVWGDTKDDVIAQCPKLRTLAEAQGIEPHDLVKSATFIRGSVYENKKLLDTNPEYLGNLLAQDEETQARLLAGNWKIRQDDTALCSYERVHDLTSKTMVYYQVDEKGDEILDEEGKKIPKKFSKKITVDAARFGRDLTVIVGWLDFYAKYIWVYTKSTTSEAVVAIEKMRKLLDCGKSDVLVDQDGVGGGVVDEGRYKGFSGGASVIEDPKTKIKENYFNLKTQCCYRFAERRINEGLCGIDVDGIKVDDQDTNVVLIGKQLLSVEKLIAQDLRCFKRVNIDMDGKKRINDKETQKIILGGRSPDFGDAFMMREWFELRPTVTFRFTPLG